MLTRTFSNSSSTVATAASFMFARRFCASNTNDNNNNNNTSVLPETHRAAPGPYRQVGNILLVRCSDIPAKHSPMISKLLRDLRLEFKGQWVAHPDIPWVREHLFRVRHVVDIESISTDEMKDILGVPAHVEFSDLAERLPKWMGRGPSVPYPYVRSHAQFSNFRKMRMRDVLERDEVERKLLDEKKMAKKASSTNTN